MYSRLKTSVPLTAALFVLGAGAASAQERLMVKVPFAFEVRGQMLPAGQYSVEKEGGLLTIRGEHGTRANVFVLATPAGGQDRSDMPVLTFDRYENGYRLTSVWDSKDHGEIVAAH